MVPGYFLVDKSIDHCLKVALATMRFRFVVLPVVS